MKKKRDITPNILEFHENIAGLAPWHQINENDGVLSK